MRPGSLGRNHLLKGRPVFYLQMQLLPVKEKRFFPVSLRSSFSVTAFQSLSSTNQPRPTLGQLRLGGLPGRPLGGSQAGGSAIWGFFSLPWRKKHIELLRGGGGRGAIVTACLHFPAQVLHGKMFDLKIMTAAGVALLIAIFVLMSCVTSLLCKLIDILK